MVAQPGDGVRPRRAPQLFPISLRALCVLARRAHRYVSLIMNQARRDSPPPSPRPAPRLTPTRALAGRVASVHPRARFARLPPVHGSEPRTGAAARETWRRATATARRAGAHAFPFARALRRPLSSADSSRTSSAATSSSASCVILRARSTRSACPSRSVAGSGRASSGAVAEPRDCAPPRTSARRRAAAGGIGRHVPRQQQRFRELRPRGAGATSGAAVLVALERELEVCETQLLELSACARARALFASQRRELTIAARAPHLRPILGAPDARLEREVRVSRVHGEVQDAHRL